MQFNTRILQMKKILLSLLVLFFVGCEEEKSTPEQKPIESKTSEQKGILSTFGISIDGDKITFDTKKSKEFLEQTALELKAAEMQIQEGNFSSKALGITMENDTFRIDMNQTKSFLKNLEQIIEKLEQ